MGRAVQAALNKVSSLILKGCSVAEGVDDRQTPLTGRRPLGPEQLEQVSLPAAAAVGLHPFHQCVRRARAVDHLEEADAEPPVARQVLGPDEIGTDQMLRRQPMLTGSSISACWQLAAILRILGRSRLRMWVSSAST